MFEVDKSDSTIWFYGEIAEEMYGGISDSMFKKGLDVFKNQDFFLRVNSPGGSMYHVLPMLNILREHKGKVTAVIDGIAASSASYLINEADEVVMQPNAKLMIHLPWTIKGGTANELRKEADVIDKFTDSLILAYVKRSGKEPTDVLSIMEYETWFNPEASVEHGFADSIRDDEVEASLLINNNIFNFKNAPAEIVSQSVDRISASCNRPAKAKINAAKIKVKNALAGIV